MAEVYDIVHDAAAVGNGTNITTTDNVLLKNIYITNEMKFPVDVSLTAGNGTLLEYRLLGEETVKIKDANFFADGTTGINFNVQTATPAVGPANLEYPSPIWYRNSSNLYEINWKYDPYTDRFIAQQPTLVVGGVTTANVGTFMYGTDDTGDQIICWMRAAVANSHQKINITDKTASTYSISGSYLPKASTKCIGYIEDNIAYFLTHNGTQDNIAYQDLAGTSVSAFKTFNGDLNTSNNVWSVPYKNPAMYTGIMDAGNKASVGASYGETISISSSAIVPHVCHVGIDGDPASFFLGYSGTSPNNTYAYIARSSHGTTTANDFWTSIEIDVDVRMPYYAGSAINSFGNSYYNYIMSPADRHILVFSSSSAVRNMVATCYEIIGNDPSDYRIIPSTKFDFDGIQIPSNQFFNAMTAPFGLVKPKDTPTCKVFADGIKVT